MLKNSSGAPRNSALSQVLDRLSLEFRVTSTGIRFSETDETGYQIEVATQTLVRERAYRLAYKLYLEKGYVTPDDREMVLSEHDANPETLTLLASRGSQKDLGTISLNIDGAQSMPCDEIFSAEIEALRMQGWKLAEVTRLAVSEADAQSRQLLIRLFYSVYVYAYRLHDVSHLLIEVNPRHVSFYQRLMGFEPIGQEKSCMRVKGAPAILLALDLERVTREHTKLMELDPGCPISSSQRFYKAFPKTEDGEQILRYISESRRAMNPFQKRYFGLTGARLATSIS
jgi:hypothetical protein